MQAPDHDILIIGSGIAGSTLGAILARQGFDVLMIEAKEHPRFAIGESMILETSEKMRALAELYDVPEIAYFSSENFLHRIGTSHGVKRHFGFYHHSVDKLQDPQHTIQAVIPKDPHGHELHLYRQDSDYFLMQTAAKYGASIYQNRKVVDVDFESELPTITLDRGERLSAHYIVDASGFRSPIADKYELRHRNLKTHSRGMFTHMIGVTPFQHKGEDQPKDLPFTMQEGTLHHVFEGGWLWVIPFNNHSQSTNSLCSVGILLDPRLHPENRDLSPEEEFDSFLKRFPEIAAQFKVAKAVRPWVRAPRIQYGSKQVVGDGWALLGHAAGFVDPLFSKGLYASLSAVSMLAHLLLEAKATGAYSREKFLGLERLTQAYLRNNDQLIANAYRTFQYPELWRRYAVLWLLGAYTEYLALNMIRADADGDRTVYYARFQHCALVGGGFEEFAKLSKAVDHQIENFMRNNQTDRDISLPMTLDALDQLYAQMDWMPQSFMGILHGAAALPRRKVRPALFKRGAGFLGSGKYRTHFFGTQSMFGLLKLYLSEKWRYGRIPFILEPRV